MSGLNTSSILSSVFSIFDQGDGNNLDLSNNLTFPMLPSLSQTLNNPNNFLLYYYVEYM
jgi:hypothetical protein